MAEDTESSNYDESFIDDDEDIDKTLLPYLEFDTINCCFTNKQIAWKSDEARLTWYRASVLNDNGDTLEFQPYECISSCFPNHVGGGIFQDWFASDSCTLNMAQKTAVLQNFLQNPPRNSVPPENVLEMEQWCKDNNFIKESEQTDLQGQEMPNFERCDQKEWCYKLWLWLCSFKNKVKFEVSEMITYAPPLPLDQTGDIHFTVQYSDNVKVSFKFNAQTPFSFIAGDVLNKVKDEHKNRFSSRRAEEAEPVDPERHNNNGLIPMNEENAAMEGINAIFANPRMFILSCKDTDRDFELSIQEYTVGQLIQDGSELLLEPTLRQTNQEIVKNTEMFPCYHTSETVTDKTKRYTISSTFPHQQQSNQWDNFLRQLQTQEAFSTYIVTRKFVWVPFLNMWSGTDRFNEVLNDDDDSMEVDSESQSEQSVDSDNNINRIFYEASKFNKVEKIAILRELLIQGALDSYNDNEKTKIVCTLFGVNPSEKHYVSAIIEAVKNKNIDDLSADKLVVYKHIFIKREGKLFMQFNADTRKEIAFRCNLDGSNITKLNPDFDASSDDVKTLQDGLPVQRIPACENFSDSIDYNTTGMESSVMLQQLLNVVIEKSLLDGDTLLRMALFPNQPVEIKNSRPINMLQTRKRPNSLVSQESADGDFVIKFKALLDQCIRLGVVLPNPGKKRRKIVEAQVRLLIA
jgi:hypothetical protein